jgi:hypothetical protein
MFKLFFGTIFFGTFLYANQVSMVKADINSDGLKDIIEVKDIDGRYVLSISIGDSNGVYKNILNSSKALYQEEDGGVMGNPFDKIVASKGEFSISFWGGSAFRWGSIYRFQWQNKDKNWRLVNLQSDFYHSISSESTNKKVDYIKGVVVVKEEMGDTKTSLNYKFSKKPIWIDKFDIKSDDAKVPKK